MKGLIFLKLRYYKCLIKVLFLFVKNAWAPCLYIHTLYVCIKTHDWLKYLLHVTIDYKCMYMCVILD